MGGWTNMGGIETVVTGGKADGEFVGALDVG